MKHEKPTRKRVLALLLCLLLLVPINPILLPLPTHAWAAGENDTLEEHLLAAIEDLQSPIDVSQFGIALGDFKDRYHDFLSNNPQLFYVGGASFSYSSTTQVVQRLIVNYSYSKAEVDSMLVDLEREIQAALSKVDPNMSDAEKCLAIHDYLTLTTEYDYDRLLDGSIPSLSYTLYGSLVDKIAVCEGYAEAFQYLMQRLGVSCLRVTSEQMNHAWNLVWVDDAYYHVDVTYDDPVRDSLGQVKHTHFLKSDKEMLESLNHYGWDASLPKADSQTYDDSFWNDVDTGMFYIDGSWYYVSPEQTLASYDFSTQTSSTVYSDPSLSQAKWNVWGSSGSHWNGNYVRLAQANGWLFYHTKDSIYRIRPDGSDHSLIVKPNIQEGYIYGIAIENGVFYASLKKTPNEADAIYVVPMDGIEPSPTPTTQPQTPSTTPPTDTPSPTPEPPPTATPSPSPTTQPQTPSPAPTTATPSPSPTTQPQTPSPAPTTATPSPSPTTQPQTPSPAPTTATPSPSPTTQPQTPSPAPTTATPSPSPTTQPQTPSIAAPAKVASLKRTIQSKKYKLKWKKAKNANGYEIYTSTKPKSGFRRIKRITKASTVTYQAKLPKKKKTLYCKVRAYRTVNGKRIYGPYSKTLSVRARK